MDLTQLGNGRAPFSEKPTDEETEQLEAEFAGLLPGRGVRKAVREAAHSFFTIGWVYGVRNGHTGPALASVDLPRADIYEAFHSLGEAIPAGDAPPVLRQAVEYHGRWTNRHGVMWVTGINASVSLINGEEYRYELSARKGNRLVVVVSEVRRASITPLPQFME